MDWSFIILLFAASLFLASMTALIIVVYKVFMKPPPANHFANAPPPQLCGWNPHPEQTPGMVPVQREESGRAAAPAFYDRPVTGLVPFGMTVVPLESPVFSPEPPVHRAVRVTPASPVPNSAAVSGAGSAWPSENTQGEVIELGPEPAAVSPKQTSTEAGKAVPVQSPEPSREPEPDNSPAEASDTNPPPGLGSANHRTEPSRRKKHSRKKSKGKSPGKKKQKGKSQKGGQRDAKASPGRTEPSGTPESPDSDASPSVKAEEKQKAVKAKAFFSLLPGPLQHIPLSGLCCILASVCLLSAALFILLTRPSGVPQDEPLIVDIPQESPGKVPKEELPEEVPPEPETLPDPVSYKMALIGEEKAESPDESGFEESFPAGDYTGTTFYALSFAIQLDSAPGTEFREIRVFDATTSEDLTAASGSVLHVYYGEVPSEDYTAAHPVKSAPVISTAVSDELITCVFVSLEKKEIDDLEIILVREDNALEGGAEIAVNSQIEEIDSNPLYTMGNSLLKLGDQYYIPESGTGIGAIPDENKYVTRKIRCVSRPLTGAAPGLDASYAAFFDKTTGEKASLPDGTKVYYKEEHKENQALTSIEFGIRMSGGDFEEAELFMDTVLPGYDLDGQSLMF